MNLNLPLKSLAKQVYMQSKLGDSTASYIVNNIRITDAVQCKMLVMWQMVNKEFYSGTVQQNSYSPDGNICHINSVLHLTASYNK